MKDSLQNNFYNHLYDFYKDLLTSKQKKYFEAYYFDDYSLFEIAEESNVTRSAVLLSLKTIKNKLDSFETKLKLKEKADKREQLYKELDINMKKKFKHIDNI